MRPTPDPALTAALLPGGVRSVFQPIVELDTGDVVAYEALARGPEGPLERPDLLFAAAREAGLLAELDGVCRIAAFTGAATHGLPAPLALFVNVEPEVLDTAPLDDLLAIADSAPGGLRVVLEITERALATRPAELLRTVARVRELGWGIALDDVGADAMSLAFMPLLRPDVVKLDLRLVQERPGPAIAQIMNAVNAYAQATGAAVLAEGIEDENHLAMARALGATLGQGWLFGRPAPTPAAARTAGSLPPPVADRTVDGSPASPFGCLPAGTILRQAPKALLIELSKQLEREAMRLGETCVVTATFQEGRHFTPSTMQRYRDLVERTGFVCALGEGLPAEPLPGLRGTDLSADDPVRGEWDVVVLAPHFSVALLARDLGTTGPDLQRQFEYALTYDRDVAVRAARILLGRVAPRTAVPASAAPARPARPAPRPEGRTPVDADADALLRSAMAATTSGVTIADMRLPDQPLVYVNEAFEQLAGLPRAAVLGRNCRFLQSPDTDPAAVTRIRAAIDRGEECRETVLNVRGPDRQPWWNEVHLAPVFDTDGTLAHYIGVQHDVTARIEAERALLQERDRNRACLTRIEELAYTDPLTGLPNRRRLEEQVETAIWNARSRSDTVALLFVDLDGFKVVNDRLGHAAGDELLQVVARTLRGRLRRGDLLARLGGDEFLVALTGLDPDSAATEARRVADDLSAAVGAGIELHGREVVVRASVGVGVYPRDGEEFAALLHSADVDMYARKSAARAGRASAPSTVPVTSPS
ncbi:diguanylate cyclase domain-containing protein [Blastococcus saxobsidens]|uniref:Diguanylate cyclase/phosphodiesterase with PAS/PAC and GAF sensor(S) n=1 Tax=Blastococcus saxobsidens (strain DD2) TaxID=1146883 RepID=H6RWC2_BLASD|nr:diguanylate cyclase [Blastococcus saxobsidens]CCG03337.1 Diguanylate cyclase/phosphodiesterase with PAS/PAC and GAF sensor(S) [Blastococcus saxobsidens DD2]